MKTRSSEVWKPVKGYETLYKISDQGNVKSLDRKVRYEKNQKILTRKVNQKYKNKRINNRGYIEVRLSKDSICKTKMLHNLLAEAFIRNPHNKPYINHIDGDKTNNSLLNLEWVTHSENMKHAYRIGLIKKTTKPVKDTCTGKVYNSCKEAAECFNINKGTLKNYLNGWNNNTTCLKYAA